MDDLDYPEIRRRILAWRARVPAWKRWLLWHLFGRDYCWSCGRATAWEYRCWNPIHEDGPPIFDEWRCRACGRSTGIELSRLMIEAVERVGSRRATEGDGES